MQVFSLLLMTLVSQVSAQARSPPLKSSSYKAAVWAHKPFLLPNPQKVLPRKAALGLMMKNLAVYREQTHIAKKQGVQIIVFPEDGIYGYDFTRKSIFPFLEKIPDPETTQWSPCKDPSRYPHTEVQRTLSCMARVNELYLVANMGDLVPCNSSVDSKCPPDHHYQHNTNVAYGPDGRLLAKYHKTHLFDEQQFDPSAPKVVYFDTPFGRFGTFICFDILFQHPLVDVVNHNITNIAYPTAWVEFLPLNTAIGIHSSIARGFGVNLLSADIQGPKDLAIGSGIYTAKGMASFYYNDTDRSTGKLLISTLYNDEIQYRKQDGSKTFHTTLNNNKIQQAEQYVKKVSDATLKRIKKQPGKDMKKMTDFFDNRNKSKEFQSDVFGDLYTFRLLDNVSGQLDVCYKNVCCSLEYHFTDRLHRDLFAFGVFDGLHTKASPEQFYIQACLLVKCARSDDKFSCGSATKESSTNFRPLSIRGKFTTKYVFPQVILSDSGQLALASKKSWSFEESTLTAGPDLKKPVLTAALLGRRYDLDPGNKA